jgi:hypothetical protein
MATQTKRKARAKAAADHPVVRKIRSRTERYDGAFDEMQNQYHDFKFGSEPKNRDFRVRFPSPKIESAVNRTYSKIYGQLLKDPDHLTEKEILDNAEERGIWSELKEDRMKSLQEKMARIQGLILVHAEENMTKAELDKITKEYEDADKELDALIAERFSLTSNSLEVRCQEIKIKDQVWQCITEVKGDIETPVWNSLEEIENERNRILVYRCVNECVSYWQGIPSDFLGGSPETPSGDSDTPSPEPQTNPSGESQ